MSNYHLQETGKGTYTLIYRAGNEIRLHSAYDPLVESERAVSQFKKGRASHIVVSGVALGYHIAELKKRYPHCHILAVEHDREVIGLARSACPANLESVTVFSDRAGLLAYFDTFDMRSFRGIAHYIHRPSYMLYREFYDGIVSEIKQQIASRVSDILTRFEFEERWISNIFRNIPHLQQAVPVHELFGRFKGYPGIIVSAGPSLRRNMDLLEKFHDRALIVCVDTAYKVLGRKKIIPHIVMTLDAQKYSVKHFLGVPPSSAVLLADVVSYPGILRSCTGEKILSTTSKYFSDGRGNTFRETTPVMDWLDNYMPPLGDIQSGGSVATSAFDFLLNLGCDPIILTGQDLAYTGREIHSSGTYHNDDWLPLCSRIQNLDTINQKVIRKRSIKYVPSYGGAGTVITDFVLDLYRGWFEDSAEKVGITVINATEGGVRIRHTVEKTLEECLREYPRQDTTPTAILGDILTNFRGRETRQLHQGLVTAVKALEDINAFISNEKTNRDFQQRLNALIDKHQLTQLINPFLRKSEMYISRHDMDEEKAGEIITRDILTAVQKLIPMISKCAGEFT